MLTVDAAGGPRIAATNMAAEAAGLVVGDGLADARAKAGYLQVQTADPESDDVALHRLALWATRYAPAVSPFDEKSGADGFFLDIGGAAHLFDGEEALIADLAKRLMRFGLPARLAVADTPGAAWALSRFHPSPRLVLPSGQEANALANAIAPLPIAALRLADATRKTLRRLGFKHVGALIDKPRAPFAARFEAELLQRLDQALGRAPEPLTFISPPPSYHRRRCLIEPVFTQEAVLDLAGKLMGELVHPLQRDGMGARHLRLSLYRVDGEVTTVDIGLALPTRSPRHVARLLALKLERIDAKLDAGFGFEVIGLAVTQAEPLQARQGELTSSPDQADLADYADRTERCAALIDGLRQRLGSGSVRRLKPVESHLPETAETFHDAADIQPPNIFPSISSPWRSPDAARPRPLLMLRRAEPAEEVTALIPEGPPRRFRWRGVMHSVALAQGPERIAGEWWRHRKPQPTRDYYLVENEIGRRFWLYREGLYGSETASPRWFVHGLFA
ncbi:protein ImuB [Rhizobiales bacterium GAS188]|nr:protein ImuB [Rhizobiales bacterium GAS188]